MERKFTEQETNRRNKIPSLAEQNIKAFNSTVKPTITCIEIEEKYQNFTREELEEKAINVILNGRVIAQRGPFLVIQDKRTTMQIYCDKKNINEQSQIILKQLDLGDIISVEGSVSKTHTNALVVKANNIILLTKALKPLPDKFHGLIDIEDRYRHRYVDTIVNEKARNTFILRTKIIKLIREYFDNLDYLEVDTPVLHPILGGAAAKPFVTFYNALNHNFYLRIATELPLKKLIVGGYERVYEIGRIFRNEGVDTTHNPEFTSIEFYEAYSDVWGMMDRTEELFRFITKKLNISTVNFNGEKISFASPFKKLNIVEALNEKLGIDLRKLNDKDAKELAKKHNIKWQSYYKLGHLINELFEKYIEETLIQPTFVYGHPIEISPLAVKDPEDPRFTLRAELFINKKEFANMFTELTDPIDQLERFENQLKEKESGNEEANEIDWDYINALEYGLPPTGGCGIGIDRLIMLLTQNDSIREVLLFPQLKDLNNK
ncbi:lysyl-tRNA synthetase [Metamycoplasma hyosynoviae]|uniref:Lysine--tRNA ligase n=1 Tax=Metamycoplasma hyosynoviae TaxID=29559 RepID=A0A063YEX5_9BACT|nr:lysine--tRNA ligase [Metamycoplasma hyosynoviae]KDE41543.1 lysyl-tRNA synthetase [Metamycoplasma hyosynoviae]KDE42990.1 lysyl-tRNA synthetase [Metamycoplasma hyosynoviae]KDE43377.1 lysyl-tRNA synthetase [Metamycoplasma hyosynoviae]KDE43581.1 lysyl-tRNA synthetase [Metamycoplasma hyosynoviae]KDE44339.1 lysyl-tRNA synthetase [Metamycoplasma hyosynoviae]